MKSLIPAQWGVPKRFRERVGESVGRQRQMTEDGHLLLVLHAVPEAGVAERAGRLFWRDPLGAWKSAGQGSGLGAVRGHLGEFEEAVDALEQQLRDSKTAQAYFEVLKASTDSRPPSSFSTRRPMSPQPTISRVGGRERGLVAAGTMTAQFKCRSLPFRRGPHPS